jgi:dextranase
VRFLFELCLAALFLPTSVFSQTVTLKDAFPDKSRYAPNEIVALQVELDGAPTDGLVLSAEVTDLGKPAGSCGPVTLARSTPSPLTLPCSVPAVDFRGYLVTVELRAQGGRLLSSRETAIDISSDWKRFPRYGYLAHYNALEGAQPAAWIGELNRFHIDGLEFYDFQYRHDQPLAGTVQTPAPVWKDIAGRTIDGEIVSNFIQQAHQNNMMAMAYNSSYSAYDDVFTRPKPFPLQWAIWMSPDAPRTAKNAKYLDMHIPGGETSKLYYMNQNSDGWQHYLFHQMHLLFEVYPFDGWHIDSFGDKGGYAYDGAPIDYVTGFKSFADRAHADLHKRILLNNVNTLGQEEIANSDADFVYSELWEDHETFASILGSAEQVHLANPKKAYVIAAYLGRNEAKDAPPQRSKQFNPSSVLLTDATIFASGADHIELGDGSRMLSSEYFPADSKLALSPELRVSLRHYYDFLTAYEVYLRDRLVPAEVAVNIDGQTVDAMGVPNTLWSIARKRDGMTVVHLINLLGSDDPHWRDISLSRPDAPRLTNLHLRLDLPGRVRSLGWASPDVQGGRFQSLDFVRQPIGSGERIEFTLPDLHYWDTVFVQTE